MAFFQKPFSVKRHRDGTFDVRIDPVLRADLESGLDLLEELLTEAPDDPAMRRLRPPAYLDDDDSEAAYQLLAGEELRTSRRAAIDGVRSSLDRPRLSDDDLWGWLQSLNALRLVLGTQLDISEDDDTFEAGIDPDDPEAALRGSYLLLTFMQFEVIKALDA